MVSVKDYSSPRRPTWCTGCGDYGVWNAVKRAFAQIDLAPHQVMIVTGIGCGSKIADYMHVNGMLTLHGRPVPVATGFKLANHDLKVVVVHGDGDSMGEGPGHMIHAARRNIDLVDIIQDNRIYGLTKGQFSPTSGQGKVTKTSPWGTIALGINPLTLALSAGATFVARSWSGDVRHLAGVIAQAVHHPGYALIDVLQPCVTFNRAEAYEFYRPLVYEVEEESHDPTDLVAAFNRAQEWEGRIPIGVIYQVTDRPSYHEALPALQAGPLVKQPFPNWSEEDLEELIDEYL